jgi:hypothetical protein
MQQQYTAGSPTSNIYLMGSNDTAVSGEWDDGYLYHGVEYAGASFSSRTTTPVLSGVIAWVVDPVNSNMYLNGVLIFSAGNTSVYAPFDAPLVLGFTNPVSVLYSVDTGYSRVLMYDVAHDAATVAEVSAWMATQ